MQKQTEFTSNRLESTDQDYFEPQKTENSGILKEIIRSSPAWFAHVASNRKWQPAAHFEIINDLLLDACCGRIRGLIVNLPPRHGKSEFISKYFPAWYLCNYPDKRIIIASYSASLSSVWGRRVRDIIAEFGNSLFNVKVSSTSSSMYNFEIAGRTGGMTSTGAGGSITGKGADLLIIDDPIKNDAEANSFTYREKIWDWFKATAYTRLEPNGILIIIMTRWHEDDLCGRFENELSDDIINYHDYIINCNDTIIRSDSAENKFVLLKIPAIASENDPLNRSTGQALWQNRFPLEKLDELQKTLGSYWFSALYQQKPSPEGGAHFKRKDFRYFIEEGDHYTLYDNSQLFSASTFANRKVRIMDCSVYATVDLAVSLKESSDYTVVLVFAVTPNNEFLILDILRERISGAEHLALIENVYHRYNAQLIGIETVQYQLSLVQSALRAGLPVKPLRPDKDKLSRMLPMAARVESNVVYFRKNAAWLQNFEDELLTFPVGRHDDQVDAFSYINYMISPSIGKLNVASQKAPSSRSSITSGF